MFLFKQSAEIWKSLPGNYFRARTCQLRTDEGFVNFHRSRCYRIDDVIFQRKVQIFFSSEQAERKQQKMLITKLIVRCDARSKSRFSADDIRLNDTTNIIN